MVKLKEKQEVYVEKEKHTIDELIRILTEKELTEINFEEKEFKIKIKISKKSGRKQMPDFFCKII